MVKILKYITIRLKVRINIVITMPNLVADLEVV